MRYNMKYIHYFTACLFVLLTFSVSVIAQQTKISKIEYRALIKRADNLPIVFNISESNAKGKISWIIKNADEKILVNKIDNKSDSLIIELPFFEAFLLLKKIPTGYIGIWNKQISKGSQSMTIQISRGSDRLRLPSALTKFNISGRWRVNFVNDRGENSTAMAEFVQVGDKLKGTFLTPTGDYRYLEGSVKGDSLVMSTFDGTHAYFFSAKIKSKGIIEKGIFAAGPSYLERWTATRDEKMVLDEKEAAFQLKGTENRLNFRFPDLDSNIVGISDQRFKDKVLVIQIMGSWCPNCMDETLFLSQYYKENKQRGIEVIGLAYEYSTDFARSKKNLSRVIDRFKVDYPILVTGVISADEMRTEKSLPQMTKIKAFPSMIFVGKDGTVRKTHAGYSGPATGIHYEEFKKEFTDYVNILLNEK